MRGPCIRAIASCLDGLSASELGSLKPMESLHQDKSLAVLPDHDRSLLAYLQDTLSDLLNRFGVECPLPLGRHIDVLDRNCTLYKHRSALGLRCGVRSIAPC